MLAELERLAKSEAKRKSSAAKKGWATRRERSSKKREASRETKAPFSRTRMMRQLIPGRRPRIDYSVEITGNPSNREIIARHEALFDEARAAHPDINGKDWAGVFKVEVSTHNAPDGSPIWDEGLQFYSTPFLRWADAKKRAVAKLRGKIDGASAIPPTQATVERRRIGDLRFHGHQWESYYRLRARWLIVRIREETPPQEGRPEGSGKPRGHKGGGRPLGAKTKAGKNRPGAGRPKGAKDSKPRVRRFRVAPS
jgi:hypothetical protein